MHRLSVLLWLSVVIVSTAKSQSMIPAASDTVVTESIPDDVDDAAFMNEDPASIEAASWEHQAAAPSLSRLEFRGRSSHERKTPAERNKGDDHGLIYIETSIARSTGSSSLPDDSLLLGAPFSSILRLKARPFDELDVQFVGAKQSGERFSDAALRGAVRYAPDRRTQIVLGDYLLNAAHGLVLSGSTIAVGEGVGRTGRRHESLRPYFGAGMMGFLRGGAVAQDIGLGAGVLRMTLLASHRSLAASIRDDGSVRSIDWSGYVRTPRESDKQAKLHETLLGARCKVERRGSYAMGVTWYRARFDRPIVAESGLGFSGDRSEVFGCDASVEIHQVEVWGEAAHSFDGASSWVLGLQTNPALDVRAAFLLRSYATDFSNPHASAIGFHSDGSNEQGAFVGFSAQILPTLRFDGSIDLSRFRGRTARNDFPSSGVRAGVQFMIGTKGGVNATLRIRVNHAREVRLVDNGTDETVRREVAVEYLSIGGVVRFPLGGNYIFLCRAASVEQHRELGLASFRGSQLGIGGRLRVESLGADWNIDGFTSNGYGAAVSVVEAAPARGVSAIVCYGDGIRFSACVSWKPIPWMMISGKIGRTVFNWKPSSGDDYPEEEPSPITGLILEICAIL